MLAIKVSTKHSCGRNIHMKETHNMKDVKLERKLEDKLMALKSENLAHYILKKSTREEAKE